MKLDGRVAVITGSDSGIGRKGAHVFAAQGARVVIAEVSEATGRETQKLIEESGAEALFIRTDVSNNAEVERMVKLVSGRFGRLDILWNNAATTKLCNEQDRPVHQRNLPGLCVHGASNGVVTQTRISRDHEGFAPSARRHAGADCSVCGLPCQ